MIPTSQMKSLKAPRKPFPGAGPYREGRISMKNGLPREHSEDPEWQKGWDSMRQDLLDRVVEDAHWKVDTEEDAR